MVTGLILDEVIVFFSLPNRSNPTMTLGQLILWQKWVPEIFQGVENMGIKTSHNLMGLHILLQG
jgi:hypothetical protein